MAFHYISFFLTVNKILQLFLALRIHISEVTKRILEALGGFIVENRGEVFLKVSLTVTTTTHFSHLITWCKHTDE